MECNSEVSNDFTGEKGVSVWSDMNEENLLWSGESDLVLILLLEIFMGRFSVVIPMSSSSLLAFASTHTMKLKVAKTPPFSGNVIIFINIREK